MNAITTSGSNIFGTPSVADLIAHFLVKNDIDTQRKKDVISALNTICKALHKNPANVCAVPGPLGREVKLINPGLMGIKPRRWKNIQSLLMYALAEAGSDMFPGHSKTPLSAECQALWDLLSEKDPWRYALSRFLRFMSAMNYEPENVCDVILDRFQVALEKAAIFKETPENIVKDTARAWNKAQRTIHSWPNITLTVKKTRETYKSQ